MRVNEQACYRALRAKDARFDGIFFVAVRSTGIYCRPICPTRPVKKGGAEFFPTAAEAERQGYRACFRCRPELAPGLAPSDAVPRLVRSAVAKIEAGYLNEHSVDALAEEEGVSARHLRRAMEAELGISPIELAQTRRLGLAKQLLHDTSLSLTDIAFAAGFQSVRRFNRLFLARFGRSPSSVRRGLAPSRTISLRLDYRPPFDWEALLAFMQPRAIAGVEHIENNVYERQVGKHHIRVTHEGTHLRAHISSPEAIMVPKLRALFDLDAQPDVINAQLKKDPLLRPLVKKHPGLRVPGTFDRFELGVRAVLGQQVSVRGASTLTNRFVERFGLDQANVAAHSEDSIASIGIPKARARTLLALARHDLATTSVEKLLELPGIGPWTAHYFAMRALRWPDAFPASDLGLIKLLGKHTEARARAWQPWRAYAVMHLWSSL